MFKFWERMDKTVKSNCICLFISLVVLGVVIFRYQNKCEDPSMSRQQTKLLSRTLKSFSSACVTGPYGQFTPPDEVSYILGSNDVRPRTYQRVGVEIGTHQPAPAPQRQPRYYYPPQQ